METNFDLTVKLSELVDRYSSLLESLNGELNSSRGAEFRRFGGILSRVSEETSRNLYERDKRLKELYESLVHTQAALSQSEKLAAVGLTVATIAHEIGTPLSSASGHVQLLLKRKDLDGEIRDELRRVESLFDRIATIIRNILTFTKPSDLERRKTNINELVLETMELLSFLIKSAQMEVKTELCPGLPAAKVDHIQLQQVFLNFISNAIGAMPDGGVLTIRTLLLEKPTSLGPNESPHRVVEIQFEDTGTGIDAENIGKVFKPFFTTRPRGEGTGLGLSICKEIVERHGGRIEVNSEKGKGTRFSIKLSAC